MIHLSDSLLATHTYSLESYIAYLFKT